MKNPRLLIAMSVSILGLAGITFFIASCQTDFDNFDVNLNKVLNPDLDKSPVRPAEAIDEFGSRPRLDRLARKCAASGSSSEACYRLAEKAPVDSDYAAYGYSCAERPGRSIGCAEVMESPPTTR